MRWVGQNQLRARADAEVILVAGELFQHTCVRVVADLENGADDLVAAGERHVVEFLDRLVKRVRVVLWDVRLAV